MKILTSLLAILILAEPVLSQTFVTGLSTEVTSLGVGVGSTQATVNAAGESAGTCGTIWIEGGATSKTISSAGGSFGWYVLPTVVFSSGTTNLRIGIQDIDPTTGLEDGVYDVQADLVGGVDPISSAGGGGMNTPMESGSKVINNGTAYCALFEMTARGGTDALNFPRFENFITIYNFPYSTTDTGGGPGKVVNLAVPFLFKFDDGTFGWFDAVPLINRGTATAAATNTGTTPDEWCAEIAFPFATKINGFGMQLSSIVAGDTFEYILYSDPDVTPDVEVAVTMDPDNLLTGEFIRTAFPTETLEANTNYCLAFRPTSANSISYNYTSAMQATNAPGMKKGTIFSVLKNMSRSNQTGAFTESAAADLPLITVNVVSLIQEPYGNNFPALFLAP